MKTIKKIFMGISLVATTGLMTACSTLQTTVIPQSENKYTVVATAESGSTAINGAIKKAGGVCAKRGKKLMVISHHTQYQGAGKTLGTVTKMVSNLAFATGNINTVPSTQTAEDYKSVIVFECR